MKTFRGPDLQQQLARLRALLLELRPPPAAAAYVMVRRSWTF
jgi:hypothetical protein